MSQYFLQEVCGKLLSPYTGKDLIQHLYEGINIYFNYTGTTKCLNIFYRRCVGSCCHLIQEKILYNTSMKALTYTSTIQELLNVSIFSTGGVWEVVDTLYRKRSYTTPL